MLLFKAVIINYDHGKDIVKSTTYTCNISPDQHVHNFYAHAHKFQRNPWNEELYVCHIPLKWLTYRSNQISEAVWREGSWAPRAAARWAWILFKEAQMRRTVSTLTGGVLCCLAAVSCPFCSEDRSEYRDTNGPGYSSNLVVLNLVSTV